MSATSHSMPVSHTGSTADAFPTAPFRPVPIPFGNVTWTNTSGQQVERGISLILYDQDGNPMDPPPGFLEHLYRNGQTCTYLFQQMINTFTATTSLNPSEEINFIYSNGIRISNNAQIDDYEHSTNAQQLWNTFENTILPRPTDPHENYSSLIEHDSVQRPQSMHTQSNVIQQPLQGTNDSDDDDLTTVYNPNLPNTLSTHPTPPQSMNPLPAQVSSEVQQLPGASPLRVLLPTDINQLQREQEAAARRRQATAQPRPETPSLPINHSSNRPSSNEDPDSPLVITSDVPPSNGNRQPGGILRATNTFVHPS